MTDPTVQLRVVKKQHKASQASGTRYCVVPVGKFFEVRAREYVNGHMRSEQLVIALPTEREADEYARGLSEPKQEEEP